MRFIRRTFEFFLHVDRLILVFLAVLATAPFTGLFASGIYLAYATGAAVLALVVAAILGGRVPFVVTLLGAVAALAVYVVFVVFHAGALISSDLADIWSGVSGSWNEMLSTSLPAVSSPTLVSLPVLLAWAASFVGVELAARTRLISAVILPSLAVFVVSLLLTGQRPVGSPITPVLLLVGSLAVVLIRMNAAAALPEQSTATRATVGPNATPQRVPTWVRVGVPLLIVVTALGVLAGTQLPVVQDDQRADLRERYQPPVDQVDGVSPLAQVSAGLNNEANPLVFRANFAVGPDAPPIDRIRIASLEQYDGAVWGTGAQLTKVGAELPTGPPAPAPTTPVTQNLTLAGAYRSSFLPALDRPTSVDGEGLLFDRQAGMVVMSGDPYAGYRYQVTSAVPRFDEAQLKAAAAGNDPLVADLALLPTTAAIPASITAYAQQPDFAKPTTYESLKAIEADMKSNHFGYDTHGTPGHSYGVLRTFLQAPGPNGEASPGRVGDSEQFASAFAVVARLKGLPSRVVVGYRLDAARVAAGDDIDVHAKDIHAWAEVNFKGIGWVPFDGTNPQNPKTAVAPPVTVVEPVTSPPSSLPLTARKVPTAAAPTCDVVANANCVADETELVLWPLFLLLIVILTPIGIVAAKVLRRRLRRTRGSPAKRVIGAWRETMDRLTTHGIPTSRSMTAAELVESCTPVAGAKPAARLAEIGPVLDWTLYREEEPSEHLVDRAWDAEAGVKDALKEETGLLKRARAVLDPRPLLPRR